MTGREDVISAEGVIRYTRESRLSQAHVSLISRVGSRIRILRGHCLRSPYAPDAGIRYDGLYIIRQYSHKENQQNGLHRVVLTLERIAGQRPTQDLAKIPLPSQLDD